MSHVLVFGVFDFFHPGHVGFLRKANACGSELLVSVARDVFVEKVKLKAPMFHQELRLKRVRSLPFVTKAVLSDEVQGSYSVIRQFKPEVICFGHDQHRLQEHCEQWLSDNRISAQTIRLDPLEHISKDFAYFPCPLETYGILYPDIQQLKQHDKLEHAIGSINRQKEVIGIFKPGTSNDHIAACCLPGSDPRVLSGLLRETATYFAFLNSVHTGNVFFKLPEDIGRAVEHVDTGCAYVNGELGVPADQE